MGAPQPVRYIELVNSVTRELPPLPVAELGPPVLTPLSKPLASASVIIVTSAGVRLKQDPPFAPVNDMSFRTIPAGVAPSELTPSHPTPVRRPGEMDVNVVFPYQRLAELGREGFVRGATPYHITYLGTIKRLTELVTGLGPVMVQAARRAGADAALFVPL